MQKHKLGNGIEDDSLKHGHLKSCRMKTQTCHHAHVITARTKLGKRKPHQIHVTCYKTSKETACNSVC